ncbi:aminoglycoside phosphotransferase family protein [Spirosoma montaniterrae]|uniref:Aminoglycoside phosphotransferase n=1 Tax=Spirosoma montaniterrae TaxID=1178516 RepID=A0A1P9WVN1_9BACT|nr:aminoglycoside phosphotransferase family protein [Spirosoma montaniterrae]AQG79388.1 aminoglycoside phosphotransferase [Spirosoma montaniterrae]
MSDKLDIDLPLVRHLIDTQFPQWTDLCIKPVALSGWDNRTFHLGDALSVRLPSAEGYTPQAAKEQYWLPRLAPQLPLPVPQLVAAGQPDSRFPYQWGIYRWLNGEPAHAGPIDSMDEFARTLAHFLRTLQQLDTTNGPLAGQHSFFRGAPLSVYDSDTQTALEALESEIDTNLMRNIWAEALSSDWQQPPVWFHGDVASGNLLVNNGKLSAVIDFGCCGIGDPACDLAIAWTFLPAPSRRLFRTELSPDDATWARGRGWALWKALITLREHLQTGNAAKISEARHTLEAIIGEFLVP